MLGRLGLGGPDGDTGVVGREDRGGTGGSRGVGEEGLGEANKHIHRCKDILEQVFWDSLLYDRETMLM